MLEQSVILRFLFGLWIHSSVSRFFNQMLQSMQQIWEHSRLYAAICKESVLSAHYQHSFFYAGMQSIFGCFFELLRRGFHRFEIQCQESFLLKSLRKILQPFERTLGLLVFVLLVVPDPYWYNVYGLGIALLLYTLFILRAVLLKQEGINFKAIDFSYPLYLFVVVFCTLTSVNFSLSLRFLVFHITCFLFVCILVSSLRTLYTLQTFIQFLVAGVGVISVYGLWQGITGAVPFDPALTDAVSNQGLPGRVYATMGNPNNFAEILILVFPFCLAMCFYVATMWQKIAYAGACLSMIGALAYTGSRSGFIAFIFSLLIFIFLQKPRWLPVLCLSGIFMLPFLPEFLLKRVMTIGNAFADSSMQYRVKIFKTVLPMLQDYWMTGVGLGTDVFMRISSRYFQFTPGTPVHTHILYTQILIETGFLGLLTFLWLIFKNIRNGLKAMFTTEEAFIRGMTAAAISALGGILLVSFLEYVWYYPRVMLIFWIVMAILMATIFVNQSQKIKIS